MTDQGVLFINLGMTGECLMIDLDGNASFVERIDGCESWPHVSRTSEDGRYWVGYVTERKGFYRPVLWTDGVPELLPMPEKNYRDEDFTTGILGRGISNDGSHLRQYVGELRFRHGLLETGERRVAGGLCR